MYKLLLESKYQEMIYKQEDLENDPWEGVEENPNDLARKQYEDDCLNGNEVFYNDEDFEFVEITDEELLEGY